MTEEDVLITCKKQNGYLKCIRRLYSYVCIRCKDVVFTTTKHISGYCSKHCHAMSQWDGRKCREIKIDKDGYVKIIAPMDHPIRKGGHARIAEHVHVMEKHLGRFLRSGENVHHKNGIKSDNRIENLELWIRKQTPGQRVEDLINFVFDNYNKEIRAKIEVQDLIRKVIHRIDTEGTLAVRGEA